MVTNDQIDGVIMSLEGGETVVDHLVRIGHVSEEDILHLIAAQFGMEVVNIDASVLDRQLAAIMSAEDARKYGVVPLQRTNDSLMVAMLDPLNYDTLDRLRFVLKCNVEGVVAPREDINKALDTLYPGETDMESLMSEIEDADVAVETRGSLDDQFGAGDASESDAPIIKLVGMIITEAFNRRASDIHLEPLETRFRVRYRIDGALQEVESPQTPAAQHSATRQDHVGHEDLEARAAGRPYQVNIRARPRPACLVRSHQPWREYRHAYSNKQNWLGLPSLASFPTTRPVLNNSSPCRTCAAGHRSDRFRQDDTLYACLGQINRPDRKIITVEDPSSIR